MFGLGLGNFGEFERIGDMSFGIDPGGMKAGIDRHLQTFLWLISFNVKFGLLGRGDGQMPGSIQYESDISRWQPFCGVHIYLVIALVLVVAASIY